MYWLKLVYNEVFYRPLLGALVFLTGVLPGHDLGLAVIILTVLIRVLTFPMTHKMLKTQKAMKQLEPEVKKIYDTQKNKEERAKALMGLYRAHGINPLSGFFSLIIQLPLLIALYQVFWKGLPFKSEEIYLFLDVPQTVNTIFLGFVPLTEPNLLLAAFAALSQFWQAKLASPPNNGKASSTDMGTAMQKQMQYVLPAVIFFVAFGLPAAVSLYWTAMNVFAIIHEAAVRSKGQRAASYDHRGETKTN